MNKYDVRVVRMAKSTPNTKLPDIINKMEEIEERRSLRNIPSNMCICLGHFDVMMVDRLKPVEGKSDRPLKQVSQDYNKAWDLQRMLKFPTSLGPYPQEENYYYPIYMLLQYNQEYSIQQRWVEQFWSFQTNYTVVTRIHQDYDSIIQKNERFQIVLQNRLMEISNEENKTVFPSVAKVFDAYFEVEVIRKDIVGVETKNKVYYIFYDSLELGDVVCISKSDSLSAILEVQRWLYESPDVNDAYSYCGIHFRNFTDNTNFPKNDKKMRMNYLDYVETRFSVGSSDYAWEFFDACNDKGYFVTGNADALMQYHNLTEIRLLENMKKIVSFDKMYDAFNDVVTRLGLVNRKPVRRVGYKPRVKSLPNAKIEIKQETFSWLVSKFNEMSHPDGRVYVHSLNKLLSTLNTMHDNSVTDSLCRLMFGGIDALVQRIEYCCEHNLWAKTDSEDLQSFLDCWTATTNAILHLESQLSQHPELMPVRYYIPAMILQFEQLIVDKSIEAISEIDEILEKKGGNEGKKQSQFVPIMLPRSQSSTSTKAILDPRNDIDYNGQAPLQIYIPIHMLYHPWRISHILCHEIAHYCGQNYRYRKKRNCNFVESAAYYITSLMIAKVGVKEYIAELKKAIDPAVIFVNNSITNILHVGDEYQYLEDVMGIICKNIPQVISRPEVTREVIRCNLEQVDPAVQHLAASRIGIENYSVCDEIVSLTVDHLQKCLRPLYSECFADMVMILLTHCTFDDYYTCIFGDEYENLRRGLSDEMLQEDQNVLMYFEHYTDRIALVASSIIKLPEYSNWLDAEGCSLEEWQLVALNKLDFWKQNNKDKGKVLKWHKEYAYSQGSPIALFGGEAKLLMDYLDECAREMDGAMKSNAPNDNCIEPIAELRKRLNLLNPAHMDWNELQDILMKNMK